MSVSVISSVFTIMKLMEINAMLFSAIGINHIDNY